MADVVYNLGREGFLAGEIDWNSSTIKVSLVRAYVFSQTHKFVSDVTTASGVIVATATLTTPTVTTGIADADDIVFTAVATGAACQSLVIYQSTAVGTTTPDVATSAQRLIAFIDSASGLPVTPNGGNINVAWSNGADKIFNL
jgi:hypothetical protein